MIISDFLVILGWEENKIKYKVIIINRVIYGIIFI